jgi:hypothetical protein
MENLRFSSVFRLGTGLPHDAHHQDEAYTANGQDQHERKTIVQGMDEGFAP